MKLVSHLRLFDAGSGEMLGFLVNLSVDGFLMVSDKPVAVGRDHLLTMDIPRAGGDQRVELQAHSLWCREEVAEGLYGTGFRLASRDSGTRLAIRHLLHDLGVNC